MSLPVDRRQPRGLLDSVGAQVTGNALQSRHTPLHVFPLQYWPRNLIGLRKVGEPKIFPNVRECLLSAFMHTILVKAFIDFGKRILFI